MRTIYLKNIQDNVDIHDITDFPYDSLSDSSKDKYCSYFGTFDTETTSILKSRHPNISKDYGFVYVWQCCIDGKIIIGKKLEDFVDFIRIINTLIQDGKRMVMYVHNLQFEFQFLQNYFEFTNIFARDKRNVIKCLFDKVEFRCSYALTNMGLAKFTEKTEGVTCVKMSGDDFDYTVERYPDTELTEDELGYCVSDVLGLWQGINSLLKDDTLGTIPMTSTGYVRRDFRECKNDKAFKARFNRCRLKSHTYLLCKEASRGAISGSNYIHTDELLEDVDSFDIKSSYPYQMATKYFPNSVFTAIDCEYDTELFWKLLDHKCCLIVWECENFTLNNRRDSRRCYTAIPYVSKAKCRAISKNNQCGNGKVFSADKIGMCCTEIDFKIIAEEYDFNNVKIHEMWIADRGMLSPVFRKKLLDMFKIKSDLDGVDKYKYSKYKNKINSTFGMMLTDILNPEIIYDMDSDKTWKEVPIDGDSIDYKLREYYSNKNSFLNYQDGVWVLAHARASLHEGMKLMGNDLIQVDTDSCKGFGDWVDYRPEFEKINERIRKEAENFDIKPYIIDKNGNRVYLGVWEYEGRYKYFKTLGAKKYCHSDSEGNGLEITVAGLAKSASKYLEEHGGFDAFKIGFKVPAGISGRTTSYYNDEKTIRKLYHNGYEFSFGSNVAVENVPYTFGVTKEWLNMILDGDIEVTESMAVDGAWWSK